MALDDDFLNALVARGVKVHAPASTRIDGPPPEHFEAGVEIHPGVTILGERSRFGRGTQLGRAGGGTFENVICGRDVELYGGVFEDCVLLDGVKLRGNAEVRGGTLLEEGCEGAHHVGYKMTIMLPWVVAGSMVNFCDALIAGGTSRKNHSEIGSSLALYNFTPWGDKHASLFGDVPRGVFLREAPIFIGGQTQIVSPVCVGFGCVIPAGYALRRDVPDGRIFGERPEAMDQPFDPVAMGALRPKIEAGLRYVGNLTALRAWYRHVRQRTQCEDVHLQAAYASAIEQIDAGIQERCKRLRAILTRLEASRAAHQKALDDHVDGLSFAQRYRRLDEHDAFLSRRDALLEHLTALETDGLRAFVESASLDAIADAYNAEHVVPTAAIDENARENTDASGDDKGEDKGAESSSDPIAPPAHFITWVRDRLSAALREPAKRALQAIVDRARAPQLLP